MLEDSLAEWVSATVRVKFQAEGKVCELNNAELSPHQRSTELELLLEERSLLLVVVHPLLLQYSLSIVSKLIETENSNKWY